MFYSLLLVFYLTIDKYDFSQNVIQLQSSLGKLHLGGTLMKRTQTLFLQKHFISLNIIYLCIYVSRGRLSSTQGFLLNGRSTG